MASVKKVLAIAGVASLVYAAGASAMVTVTKHNFSAGQGTGGQTRNVWLTVSGEVGPAKGEVCVFCHSPHGAVANAPLWNRAIATAGNYSPYVTSTIDAPGVNGTDRAGRQPQGVSLACLSCHDGTIAIDALRNAPGPGNYQTNPISRGWSWQGLQGDNTLPEDGRITNLTQNLTNQHPISIEYPNYGTKTGANAYDPMFYTPDKVNASTGLRWFDYGPTANKTDDNEVRLYATDPANTSKVFVECASCHNPHGTEAASFGGTPGDDGTNFNTFLRRSNNNSALCTTCHIK